MRALARSSPDRDLDRLYREHAAAIADSIYRRIGDRAAAEDLAADVFLAAARALPRYRDQGVPVRHWLLRIATRAVSHWVRARRRAAAALPEGHDAVDPASEGAAADVRDAEQVQRALLTLPTHHQEVVALHYFEDLEIDAVARLLGCAAGTVKSRLARARALLRERLERADAAEREARR